MEEKIPVIFDTDICHDIDDLYALLVCILHPKIDLKAVTLVYSEVLPKAKYIAKIFRMLGVTDVPIGIGARVGRERLLKSQPLPGINDLVTYHKYVKDDDPEQNMTFPTAYEVISNVLDNTKEKVTIVCEGALTNIGKVVTEYPMIREKVKQIALMGGEVTELMPEYNIICDPESAELVFNCGLEVFASTFTQTMKIKISMEDTEKYFNDMSNPIHNIVSESTRYWHDDFQHDPVLYDLAPVFWLIDNDLIKYKQCELHVEIDGKFTRGYTIPNYNSKNKLVHVSVETNYEEIMKRTLDLLLSQKF